MEKFTKEKRIPWNKGKKGLQVSWNKGTKGVMKNSMKGEKMPEKWRKSLMVKHKKGSGLYVRKVTPYWLGKKRIDLTGENHPKWIKDRTQLKKSDRKPDDVQYIYWRKQVKDRDHWKCRLESSECKGRLEAHHIFSWVDYPELRYVINNGITLCQFHHPKKWEEEKRMIPILQELLSVSKVNFE